MDASLLDTDILTELFKGRNATVTAHANAYLQVHGQFTVSAFTYFEIIRGLRYKKASAKIAAFDQLSQSMNILPVTGDVLDRAADLWADGRASGQAHHDADLIIAATAILNGLQLVSGNTPHFEWMPGLLLANWKT